MRANKGMRMLLREYDIEIEAVGSYPDYPITKKLDSAGRPYWCAGHFYDLDKNGVGADRDLSQLEWDGNEISLNTGSQAGITRLLIKGIGLLKAWKEELEQSAPETGFCLFASFDGGDGLVNEEDFSEGCYTLTLRFWAQREGEPLVDWICFDEWDEPALVDFAGKGALR